MENISLEYAYLEKPADKSLKCDEVSWGNEVFYFSSSMLQLQSQCLKTVFIYTYVGFSHANADQLVSPEPILVGPVFGTGNQNTQCSRHHNTVYEISNIRSV